MRIATRSFVTHAPSAALKKPAQPIKPEVEKLALSLIGTVSLKRTSQANAKVFSLTIRDPLATQDAGALISLLAPELLRKGFIIERLSLPVSNGSKVVTDGQLELHRDTRIAGLGKLKPEQIAAHLLADDMKRAQKLMVIEKHGEKRVHFSGSSSAYAVGLDDKAVFAALKDLLPKSVDHVGSLSVSFKSKGLLALSKPKLHVEFIPTLLVLKSGRIF